MTWEVWGIVALIIIWVAIRKHRKKPTEPPTMIEATDYLFSGDTAEKLFGLFDTMMRESPNNGLAAFKFWTAVGVFFDLGAVECKEHMSVEGQKQHTVFRITTAPKSTDSTRCCTIGDDKYVPHSRINRKTVHVNQCILDAVEVAKAAVAQAEEEDREAGTDGAGSPVEGDQ
jgi:hypothetical protein